ncbi:hypothetical protein REPUB_Repub11eG0071800 [Reevesia pubescens]
MTEEIEDLWSRFTLTKDEQRVVTVDDGWYEKTLAEIQNCLLGKLLSNKVVHTDTLMSVFAKVWRIQSGLQIREVVDKLFIFHFENQTIKDHILLSQPWAFNRSLLVLKELNGLDGVDKIDIEWCLF